MASDVLLQRSFRENLPRLMEAAGTERDPTPPAVADAILGGVALALPPLRTVLTEFIALTKTKHLRKSDRQRHLWRLPRERAVSYFEKALPKFARHGIDAITREDALAFRDWWSRRIWAVARQLHAGLTVVLSARLFPIHGDLWLLTWRVPFNSIYVLVNGRHRIKLQPARRPKMLFVFNVHPVANVTQAVSISEDYIPHSEQEFQKIKLLHT